ncbi:helicase-associated domain-containing protein [Alicyclobacillus cycloheptanicus]|uniref:DNA 3'-5' helicase n=1 Tax=Alicyclobacillus cycloheptanicus TaxID=1457 RepID=A0ABT9XFE4_9BACL|nr:DNA repair helicase XPB [Alicyclobacillus cycloheptanicus]MDQ0188553.1 DNA excision repair protein ERCC-3 [Alicyclobacillus cycloheptanicus]WDM01237.1 helicase-associated domain-containing protein [Alicyclobacillus cycloheptanicus]
MIALLYVQSDGSMLVETEHPAYDQVRHTLAAIAALVQRMEPLYVYQIRPFTLWQAAALGYTAREVLGFLRKFSANPVPYALQQLIVSEMGKWGRLILQRGARNRIALRADRPVLEALRARGEVSQMAAEVQDDALVFHARDRAKVKQVLAKLGFPVIDRAGYRTAPSVEVELSPDTTLRPYQREAVHRFFTHTAEESGVVVLPCGAGKTLVGIAVLAQLKMQALILTPSFSSAAQWRNELLHRTSLTESNVCIYEPGQPPAPITITTYQRVTSKARSGDMPHLTALTQCPWGIVIYDEVHMLPAPLFRLAADLQSSRRLGLTATLVREDGAETDVFSLIGPKCFEVPWRQLEQEGYLSTVRCVQVEIALPESARAAYAAATARDKHRIAALNEDKLDVVEALCRRHHGESILIIGHYLESLERAARRVGCPLVTGRTPESERLAVFDQFRRREIRCIALSRVANMAVDLPVASVGIQISGLFGSRQEEAQRLGRLLRPASAEGTFYSLVSKDTLEMQMAKRRQLYLVEQGYSYEIIDSAEVTWYLPNTERMKDCELVGVPEHR